MEVASRMPYGPSIRLKMRWMVGLKLAVLAGLAVAVSGAGTALSAARFASSPTAAASAADVAGLAQRDPAERIGVIVQLRAGASAIEAMRSVRAAGGSTTGRLLVINGFGARLSAAAGLRLSRRADVRVVSLDGRVAPQSIRASDLDAAYPFSTGAAESWNASVPATGKGIGVAVIDTGIAGDLPDFRVSGSGGESRVIASAVVNPDATTAGDSYGHGTHVAGIIAGNSWNRPSGDPLQGHYVGVAPDANLISVKASDDAGNATVLDVIYGLQFAVDHKDELNIRVVNLSLESTTAQSYTTDPLDTAVESAWFHGIVVIAAAGNRGAAADAVTRAPGNDPYVISVGGVDDQGTRAQSDDTLASWSARGVTQDGVAKPEINAPGAHIVSNLAPASAFTTLCPTCVVSGQYIRAGGTSMAAPMVSGVAALVLERYPNLTPDQLKGLLARSARVLPGGLPAVSASAALKSAAAATPAPANQRLTPNELVDATTGAIDYTRSSWSRSTWSDASDLLRSSWSRSSWSCDCFPTTADAVDPTRSSWSRSSWSRSSWSTSWTK